MEYFIESISINKIRHLENLKIDISNNGEKTFNSYTRMFIK